MTVTMAGKKTEKAGEKITGERISDLRKAVQSLRPREAQL